MKRCGKKILASLYSETAIIDRLNVSENLKKVSGKSGKLENRSFLASPRNFNLEESKLF